MHEELLTQIRSIVYNPEGTCVHGSTQATGKTKHGHGQIENISNTKYVKGLGPTLKRSPETIKVRSQSQGALASESEAAGQIAKVFDNLVWIRPCACCMGAAEFSNDRWADSSSTKSTEHGMNQCLVTWL